MMRTSLTLAAAMLASIPTGAGARPESRQFDAAAASGRRGCLVIGDSIAVGLGAALRNQGIGCDVFARKGLTARQISLLAPVARYAVAYVSAGSNSPRNPRLENEVRMLRSQLRSSRVVWILPYDRTAAQAVNSNAAETGGLVVDMAWFATRDGVHPVSYAPLARMIVR